MKLATIRAHALRHGYTLKPLPWALRETVDDVANGRTTASEISAHRGLNRTAAYMRLRLAADAGLVVLLRIIRAPRSRGVGVYTLTPLGRIAALYLRDGAAP
jgi:hypothetical protein